MNAFDVGDTVRLTATFRDPDGNLMDPASVTLQIRKPSGEVVSVPVVRDSTGVYHGDVTVDESGLWTYRWYAPGGAEEGAFFVRFSGI